MLISAPQRSVPPADARRENHRGNEHSMRRPLPSREDDKARATERCPFFSSPNGSDRASWVAVVVMARKWSQESDMDSQQLVRGKISLSRSRPAFGKWFGSSAKSRFELDVSPSIVTYATRATKRRCSLGARPVQILEPHALLDDFRASSRTQFSGQAHGKLDQTPKLTRDAICFYVPKFGTCRRSLQHTLDSLLAVGRRIEL